MTNLRRAVPADLDPIAAHQKAAYARNRDILGADPLPMFADYAKILQTHECWVAVAENTIEGLLVLDFRPDDMLIWNVSTHPHAQGRGLGNELLAFAERRAREAGRAIIRLYTAEVWTANVAWYRRHGFAIERIEELRDRRRVHMAKTLDGGIT